MKTPIKKILFTLILATLSACASYPYYPTYRSGYIVERNYYPRPAYNRGLIIERDYYRFGGAPYRSRPYYGESGFHFDLDHDNPQAFPYNNPYGGHQYRHRRD